MKRTNQVKVMPTTDSQATKLNQINIASKTQLNKPILQQGSQGDTVKELQKLLTQWGTYTGTIDSIFGSSVKRAVIDYQHRVFLIEDGVVGRLTWQALYSGAPVNMPVLSQGSFGDSVILVQKLLNSTNEYFGLIDGDFGSQTKAAVQVFQNRLVLSINGVVADRTWYYLSQITH
jgi:peptidoglycan hydrolase-like protein with peptidoglycan-binding domain